MSELYFVRHGQASFGADNYDKLSPLGYKQSYLLGQYFKNKKMTFDRVITGDLIRHHETALGICEGLGRNNTNFEVLPDLNEFDFKAIVHAYLLQFPDQKPNSINDTKAYFRLLKKSVLAWQQGKLTKSLQAKSVESWIEFDHRVGRAITFIHQSSIEQKGLLKQRILVICSGGSKAMAMKHILSLQDEKVMLLNLQIMNTSISRFICSAEQIILNNFNHVPHLIDENDITYS
jgi:broad specificity phosphatase PhoE